MLCYKKWLTLTFALSSLIIISLSILSRFFLLPIYDVNNIRLEKNIDTLIVGASHGETGINPKYLNNSLSITLSGEQVFWTYYKVKALLRNNPNIKRIIIPISPIHLGAYTDKYFFTGNSGSREQAMKYYKFIDDETDPLIPLFNSDRVLSYLKFKAGIPFNYLDDLKFILKNMLGTISYKDFDYIGGWSPQLSNNISRKSIETKARFYFYDENREVNVSPIALESIRRIFSLSSSVQVIVINTPKHKIFRQHVPKKIKQKYDSIIENAIDNGQIQYIDYSDFVLNDINFYDGDHLNKSGSDIFSKTLSSDIKKSFLKKQN